MIACVICDVYPLLSFVHTGYMNAMKMLTPSNSRYKPEQANLHIPGMPSFNNKRDEILWKLNYAKKTLSKAREIEMLAKKAAVHFGYYQGNRQGHREVKDLIGHSQDVLMDASDKMGFAYEKY